MTETRKAYAEAAAEANRAGRIIVETDDGLAQRDPSGLQRATARLAAIDARLAAIDAESVRPLRAMIAGEVTEDDRVRLAALEAEAVVLRAERAACDIGE